MFYNKHVNLDEHVQQVKPKATKRKLSPTIKSQAHEPNPKKKYNPDLHCRRIEPVNTEYINPKCILHIYYKNEYDAIEEHFARSLSKPKRQNKPASSSNTNFYKADKSDNLNQLTYRNLNTNNYQKSNQLNYWSTTSNQVSNIGNNTDNSSGSYDICHTAWPYYAYQSSTPNQQAPTPCDTHNITWNKAAADMAASFYNTNHRSYTAPLASIHHHHHHQFNSILTNNIFTDPTSTQSNHGIYTTPMASTLVNDSFTSNSAPYEQTQLPTTSFDIYQTDQYAKPGVYEQPQTTIPLNPYKTETTNSSAVVSQVAAAAAVAAVAANQYLNDNLHAVAQPAKYNSTQTNRHSQYNFDLTKPAFQDCRRATNIANNHYTHLSSHMPYSGFDLPNTVTVDSSFKDTSNANSYATPIWY